MNTLSIISILFLKLSKLLLQILENLINCDPNIPIKVSTDILLHFDVMWSA